MQKCALTRKFKTGIIYDMEYKNYTIHRFQAMKGSRISWRIYLNDEYKQTASSMKSAKQTIDFWTKEGIGK